MSDQIIDDLIFYGPWEKVTAPNGSVSSCERVWHHIRIFRKDNKLFVRGTKRLQRPSGQLGPPHDFWEDGNDRAIAAWLRDIQSERENRGHLFGGDLCPVCGLSTKGQRTEFSSVRQEDVCTDCLQLINK